MPVDDGKAGRDQRVVDLEIAGKRQVDLVDLAAGLDLGALAVALVLDALELQEIALAADGEHIEARGPRRLRSSAPTRDRRRR